MTLGGLGLGAVAPEVGGGQMGTFILWDLDEGGLIGIQFC